MPIPEQILNQMKCCLSNDGHIVIEPVLLTCGANACKQCVNLSSEEMMKCFSCNEKHAKKNFLNSSINTFVETSVKSFLAELFQDLNFKLNTTIEASKG